ncbi:hypothetical protein PMAYCL1PPCAC_19726, partial [Pristionchus mayeri]
MDKSAYIKIGDDELSDVSVTMDLKFDSKNNGYLGVSADSSGHTEEYDRDGKYTETFNTYYFEIQWAPTALQPAEIASNHDNCYIDIQVSYSDDEFECPDQYSAVTYNDGQHWCYIISFAVPPAHGFTYSEARELCESTGDSLPILTTDLINDSVWK